MDNGSESPVSRIRKNIKYRYYPGIHGIPFRLAKGQQMPSFKNDDGERQQPKEVSEGHAKIFKLGDPAQLEAYNEIIDRVAKGQILLSKEEMHWSDKDDAYHIFLRWVEMYLETPDGSIIYEVGQSETASQAVTGR